MPIPFMMYRVRYMVYRISAKSQDEALSKVCKMMQADPSLWIRVEQDTPKRGVLSMLLFGTK
jgi:hypothetical protein